MSFEFFLRYGPMLTKKKKNRKKIKMQNLKKKNFWRYDDKVPFQGI